MSPQTACRIRQVRVRAVRVPIAQPHLTAGGAVSESPLVLTDVVMDDGLVGHSMVFTYTAAALKPVAELIRNLEPLIQGDVLAPVDVEHKLARRFRLLGTQGLVGMAIAAIDMALWDALARSQGVSLVRLLGAAPRPMPAYGAVGFDGVDGAARAALACAERGFTSIKAKIGYPTVQEDLAVVRAMRSAVGPAVAIMVDYNQSLTPAEAVQRLRPLDDEGLTWVEVPTLAHDHAGHALVAREARTPIQCGENWWGILDLRHALDAQACDLMMPGVMKIGGVTGWLRAVALAQAHNMPMSNHLFPEISAQLLCLAPTAHWLEYVDWWSPVLREPLALRAGMAHVDEALASGVDWNESAVERWLA